MKNSNWNSLENQIDFLANKRNATIEIFEDLTIASFSLEVKGVEKMAVTIFRGKSKNPILNCYFRNITDYSERILGLKESALDRIESDKEYKAEKKARFEKSCKEIKEGDILYNSWGYEQTNVDFYLITGRPSKCFVMIQKIGSKIVEGSHGHDCCRLLADPSNKIGEPERRKIGSHGSVSVGSYSFQSASKWDGSEVYCSWYY